MAVSVDNNISSHTGEDKNEGQSVWRIAISVLTLEKKLMTIGMENYNNTSSDNGQDKTEQHNQYGELQQYQFSLWTRQN